MTRPALAWSVHISGTCPNVAGLGYACQFCPRAATGHIRVTGGPCDNRCLALVCPWHATEGGWHEVKALLSEWAAAGFLNTATGGPGVHGAPQVWHVPPGETTGHYDPMPDDEHEATP